MKNNKKTMIIKIMVLISIMMVSLIINLNLVFSETKDDPYKNYVNEYMKDHMTDLKGGETLKYRSITYSYDKQKDHWVPSGPNKDNVKSSEDLSSLLVKDYYIGEGEFWNTFTGNFKNSFKDGDKYSYTSVAKGMTKFLSSTYGARSGISRLFYDPTDPTWSDENDGMMATLLGGMDRWTEEMCRGKAKNLDAASNEASFVVGASGTSYAHIEGERTTVVSNNQTEYLYVVSYGINAYECDMTINIYLDDDKIDGEFKLEAPDFSLNRDDDYETKKNTSKSGRYVNYSTTLYSKACLRFDEVPWCLRDLKQKEICNQLNEASEQSTTIDKGFDMWPFS